MTATCNCGTPARDTNTICDGCADLLWRALNDIAWLDSDLDTTIAKQRAASTEGGPPSADTGMPWNEAAADAKRHLHGILVAWARLCMEERVPHRATHEEPPDNNLVSLSRWLMWRVDGLARHAAGHEAVHEVSEAVRACFRVIDRRPEREFVGPCECGRDLYRRPGATTARCRGCEREYDGEEMLTWMRNQVADRLVTAREGAGLLSKFGLETTVRAVAGWAERGRIQPVGSCPKGYRTYRFDDLLQHALGAQRDKVGAVG